MALHKLSLITILMVLCNILATAEFMENPEDLPEVRDMDTNSPSVEIRQKRQAMEVTVSDIPVVNDLTYLLTPATFPLRLESTTEISNANLTTGLNIKSYYIIDIDVTVSDIAMIDYLRNFLKEEQFPIVLNNDTELINVNLTTVCSPNGTGFQCKCEEQFAWSYNSCVKYTPCDDIIDGICGCISAVPSDGQFCSFKPSLDTTSHYISDIDVTVSDPAMIDHLRNFLKEMQYPYNITTDTELITVNLTTVCYPNGTEFQCRCEDQFAWSYNSCVTYTPCDDIIHDTCECINAMPSDGQSCHIQPHPVMSSTTQTVYTTTASPTKGPTPAPLKPSTSPTKGPTPAPLKPSTSPTKGPTPAPLKPSTSPTKGPTAAPLKPSNFTWKMSFKIQQNFDKKLTDQSSSIFRTFKEAIEPVLISNYKHINGFVQVEVLQFRSGSVITDFVMATNSVNSTEIATLDSNIAADLQALGYNTDPRSFSGVIYANVPFTKNFDIIYPGYTIELTCEVPESLQTGNGSWFVNGVPVSNNTKYTITNSPPTLTVKDMSIADNGLYNFTLTNYFLTFTHEENLSVTEDIPPIIQLNQSSINAQCDNGNVPLRCCVTYYNINAIITEWVDNSTGKTVNSSIESNGTMTEKCTSARVTPECGVTVTKTFTCRAKLGGTVAAQQEVKVTFFSGAPDCNDTTYGVGTNGSVSILGCAANFMGNMTAVCVKPNWTFPEDNCVFSPIVTLLQYSQKLAELGSDHVPLFVHDLNTTTTSFQLDIEQSPATISTIVTILNNVADVSGNTSISMMEDILETVSVLVSNDTRNSWTQLNGNNTDTSSLLLESVENFTKSLSSDSVNITKPNIQLNKTTLTFPFKESLNLSQILIPSQGLPNNTSITTVVFTTLDFVLPNRTNGKITNNFINGIVMLVYVNQTIKNVSMTFDKRNKTKGSNQCVFWNFKVFNDIGGWDSTGCQLDSETDDNVTCSCNHLTSFSILMSPFVPNSPFLDYITYIGVGISVGCLVLCLIIEASVWNIVTKNSTAHMRHVAIVNIALSLLIADIWFIIGAAVSGQNTPKNACSAATFFIHFFYLALFFWMLISALFLFYRTMMVFSHMSKRTMMAISFTVGYGAPLIIAIITIAVTAPKNGYFGQDGVCWLNWYQTKALLAFVIPALIIVFVNLLILIVILVKLLMRGVGENRQSEEKNALVVIARCVAVLTPIFGITWGFGIGTMVEPTNLGIQIVFTLFNAFQGCFILVFGTLIDSRIRSAIAGRFAFLPLLSTGTKSTNAGPSLSSLADRIRRRGKNVYNVSSATASQGSYEAFVNSDEPILQKF
ncbi:adhesion G protein-coupled receptor F5-like isoform X2 [Brienomyrus brachyistius]|uniref:adhesion G protein-coupled receptor F5-like isoform X2 n=1 Tax=Brienomyrus brachyistius TaxID=42636 RepID=UPI0020B36533|nr:adhesion G protein-coupled receptor F5-like isoform X2 [Brienomyrus brachyistius]